MQAKLSPHTTNLSCLSGLVHYINTIDRNTTNSKHSGSSLDWELLFTKPSKASCILGCVCVVAEFCVYTRFCLLYRSHLALCTVSVPKCELIPNPCTAWAAGDGDWKRQRLVLFKRPHLIKCNLALLENDFLRLGVIYLLPRQLARHGLLLIEFII